MWEEKIENFVERNGDFVRNGQVASYETRWRNSHQFVDSSNFIDPGKRINVPYEIEGD